MRFLPKVRVSLGVLMMFVLTAAAASALFVKVRTFTDFPSVTWYRRYDSASLIVIAINLTAIALGSIKSHSATQIMLQATLSSLGYLSIIQLGETGHQRILLYWLQIAFALLVAVPLFARKMVKHRMDRGPRLKWWKRTLEAFAFSFLNMLLVLVGGVLQFFAVEGIGSMVQNVP